MPEGQALLSGLLESCFEVAQDIKAREAEEDMSPSLKPIYERLSEMKKELDRLCAFTWHCLRRRYCADPFQ